MRFSWDQTYSVGIKEIDKQHQQFFKICQQIYQLVDNRDLPDHLLKIVTELGNYSQYHLSVEESYFRQFQYPQSQPHVDSHNEYRTKINHLLQQARQTDVDYYQICQSIAEFAQNWLAQHIKVMDKQYSSYFRHHGLK
jgi:hemerythrin-like metal-binding protein